MAEGEDQIMDLKRYCGYPVIFYYGQLFLHSIVAAYSRIIGEKHQ